MTNDRMLPDPSDYSDDSEPLDDEMVVREWESSLSPQDAIQALNEMVRDADYEVSNYGYATKAEIIQCVGIRGTVLDLIIELEGCLPKVNPEETKIDYTLEQIQDLYVEPVRKELQGALDVAVREIEVLKAGMIVMKRKEALDG